MTGIELAMLLSALCFVESGHNPAAVHMDDGGSPSIGYCQVKLKTARWLGYRGNAKGLLNKEENVKWAGAYLKKQLTRYRGDVRKAVSAFNCGSACGNTTYVERVLKARRERR